MRYIAVAALLLSVASAAELESQHALEYSTPLTAKLSVTLHSRLRTKPESVGLYQTRLGPILSYAITKPTHLLAGYYHTRTEPIGEKPWSTVHRVFVGGEHEWTRNFDTRTILERYYSVRDPEFNRFRQRFRYQTHGRLAPYTAIEFFLDAHGWRSTRYFGGIRTPWFLDSVSFDWGYFFETRRAQQGGNRHMLMTAIYFHRSTHRKDADR